MNPFVELAKLLNPSQDVQGVIHKIEGNTYLVSSSKGSLMCSDSSNNVLKVGDSVLIKGAVIVSKAGAGKKAQVVTV
jgi:uncharacterized Zn ribbon protein